MYSTHASSSTSTDDNFTLHLYSIQANSASSGIDSRLATRSGFCVSTTSSSGLKLGESDKSQLDENLDSGLGVFLVPPDMEELSMLIRVGNEVEVRIAR